MSIAHKTVRTLAELISEVSMFTFEQQGAVWYRGHAEQQWDLLPFAFRESGWNERAWVNEFRLHGYSRSNRCPQWNERVEWLSLMQHCGLPTRLLDWTLSPLNAAYFACADPDNKHKGTPASIWVLNPISLNGTLIGVESVPPLSQDSPVVMEIIKGAFEDAPPDPSIIKKGVCAAQPQHRDIRMLVQQSAFTAHQSTAPLNKMPECEDCLIRFDIPANAKPSFIYALAQLGIREMSLYPDLDHLSATIREQTGVTTFARLIGNFAAIGFKSQIRRIRAEMKNEAISKANE